MDDPGCPSLSCTTGSVAVLCPNFCGNAACPKTTTASPVTTTSNFFFFNILRRFLKLRKFITNLRFKLFLKRDRHPYIIDQ